MHPEIAVQEFGSLSLFADDDVKFQCQKFGQPSGLKVLENESSLKNLLAELPGVIYEKKNKSYRTWRDASVGVSRCYTSMRA